MAVDPSEMTIVDGATLFPATPDGVQGLRQVCGVFDRTGRRVDGSDVAGRMGVLTLPGPVPAGTRPLRRGTWLYAGVDYHHFGHGLIFGLSRLWALDHVAVDGIVFLARGAPMQTRAGCGRHISALMNLLGIELPVVTVGLPEEVERLVVPPQGIGTDPELFPGLPAFRDFIRRRLGPPAGQRGTRDIHVSRTGLGRGKAGWLHEDRLEAYLRAEGYETFHPQVHSLSEQVETYASARRLIGIDGSALHLAAFALPEEAKFAALARRRGYADDFATQARSFAGADAHALHPITRSHAPERSFRDGTLWMRQVCEVDFPRLQGTLARAGFIASGNGWTNPTDGRTARRLARISRAMPSPLKPIPEALKSREPC